MHSNPQKPLPSMLQIQTLTHILVVLHMEKEVNSLFDIWQKSITNIIWQIYFFIKLTNIIKNILNQRHNFFHPSIVLMTTVHMKHGFRRFFPPYTACEHTCGNIIRSFSLLGKIWKQRSRNWKIKFQNYVSLIFKTRPKLCYFTLISRFYCMQKLFLGNTSSIWIWIYDREKRRYNSNQIYICFAIIKGHKTQ